MKALTQSRVHRKDELTTNSDASDRVNTLRHGSPDYWIEGPRFSLSSIAFRYRLKAKPQPRHLASSTKTFFQDFP